MPQNFAEIGGYFGLDLPDYGDYFKTQLNYQSARAGFHAVLEQSAFSEVWIPSYICDSIITAAKEAGLKVKLYALDRQLMPIDMPNVLNSSECIIYVNYFGLFENNINKLIKKYTPDHIFIDSSQALFTPHMDVSASVYSPRKFAGLPDGGFVLTNKPYSLAETHDNRTFDRMKFLLMRMAYSAREGYKDFNLARETLLNTTPTQMSKLTKRLMRGINWKKVKFSRQENFKIIHSILGITNDFAIPTDKEYVPLCYPYTSHKYHLYKLKAILADKYNIFTATYWPDAFKRTKPGSYEETLLHKTLYLPVDQRLNKDHIKYLCNTVSKLIDDNSNTLED